VVRKIATPPTTSKPKGYNAALRFLRAKHGGVAEEHEDIAAEAVRLVFEHEPHDPDAYAVECADRLAKARARALLREKSATPQIPTRTRIRTRRRTPPEKYDDAAELHAAVVAECRRRFTKATGQEWTDDLHADVRRHVDELLCYAYDVAAARALWDAARVVLARLEASGNPKSMIRKWLRKNVDAMDLGLPLVAQGVRVLDERAALVEVVDGESDPTRKLFGRPARPIELATVYYLAGFWLAPPVAALKKGVTVASVLAEEGRRMADHVDRHGDPVAQERLNAGADWLRRMLDPDDK
jgi:hypothetical protein